MNALARLGTRAVVRPLPDDPTTSGTGYPWQDGDILYADDLNAAFSDSFNTINVLNHGAKGDGVTNDTVAIQAVLDAYAGKATVFIPNTGHPYMVAMLRPPSNTDLLIHGTVKFLPEIPQGVNNLLHLENVNNVTIRGYGVFDGAHVGGGVLLTYQVNNLRVEDVTFQNAWYWDVNVTRTTNARLDRVSILNGRVANEFADGCDNCWISNSYITGATEDGGFVFYGGVTNSGIVGCVSTGAFVSGIAVYSDVAQPAPCSNIVIANNIVHNCGTGGISVGTDGTSGAVAPTGIIISGNRCYANNNIIPHQYADIWIDHGTSVTVTGNNISGSGCSTTETIFSAGIFVGVPCSHVSITGNTIWNEGHTGSGTGSGIYLQMAPDVLIEGNHFYDNQTTRTMTYGIDGLFGARNVVIGNLFGTLGVGPVRPTPISDTVIVGPGLSGISNAWNVFGAGISYNGGHAIALDWNGMGPTLHVDGMAEGSLVFSSSHTIELEWGGQTVTVILDGTTQGSMVRSTNEHQLTMAWGGASGAALSCSVDGVAEGIVLTDIYVASRPSAANDAAAAALGVPVNGVYRNGSVVMIRVG